jgi:hypothetical protein
MVPSTDHQETMFEEPVAFTPTYEEEAPYEPGDDLSAHESDCLDVPEDVNPEDTSSEDDHEARAMQAAEPESESEPVPTPEPAASHPEPPPAPQIASAVVPQPDPLPVLTVDDFAALEERVLRTVSLVGRERQARIAAEERVLALEARLIQLQGENSVIERLQLEVDSLRVEREQVRLRVERLLGQLDALEL